MLREPCRPHGVLDPKAFGRSPRRQTLRRFVLTRQPPGKLAAQQILEFGLLFRAATFLCSVAANPFLPIPIGILYGHEVPDQDR
jgi:hypothetical protein